MNIIEENIIFNNNELSLHGTLSKPGKSGVYPVLIVSHASHAGTREFHVYKNLTRILPAIGFAVFLFDRRGCGKSTGDFETATFHDLADDQVSAINYLRNRSDIDPKCIGLWGLSQGGWIAPLAATKSKDVAFVVALSSSGNSPAEQMSYSAKFEMVQSGFSESDIQKMLKLHLTVGNYYRGKVQLNEVKEELKSYSHDEWFGLAYVDNPLPKEPQNTKWFQEMDYDPIPVMEKLDIPILLLYAECDPWVSIDESLARWKKYGPSNITVSQISDANHFMISIAESGIYGDVGPIAEEYEEILIKWIKKQNHTQGRF